MENWIDSDDVHYEFEGRRKHSNSPGGRNTILIPPAAEYHNGPIGCRWCGPKIYVNGESETQLSTLDKNSGNRPL